MVEEKNQKDVPKGSRYLQIVWEEQLPPERIGIFGIIMVKLNKTKALE